MEYVDQAVGYLRDGFGTVNGDWRYLILALVAAILMPSWRQWVLFALGAVVVHIAVQKLAPVLAGNGGDVNLPPIMETSFWVQTGVLALGYFVIIGIFFFLKGLVFRRSAAAH